MKTVDAVKIFLLGMIAALLLITALRPESGVGMAATSATSKGGDLMALAGTNGQLFVIDTVNKYVAQYAVRQNNGEFTLFAGRYIGHDLAISETFKRNGMTVKEAKEEVDKEEKEAKIEDLIAVAGDDGNLFLIDAKRKYLAQYQVDNQNRFLLRSARNIRYDLSIQDTVKNNGIPLKEAKKLAEKSMTEKE